MLNPKTKMLGMVSSDAEVDDTDEFDSSNETFCNFGRSRYCTAIVNYISRERNRYAILNQYCVAYASSMFHHFSLRNIQACVLIYIVLKWMLSAR